MANIKLYNKISQIGLDVFNSNYNVGEDVDAPEGILVRSAALHEIEFNKELCAIARAGAGVNNIPIDRCSENGIVVFNTPGANANGVKELAVAALLLASRNIVGGINWASGLKGQADIGKLVEKGKSKFVGPEIKGKTLGVIGLGAIGGMVANIARALGMNVVGCDPFITVKNAWALDRSVRMADTYDEIYAQCDYITYHIPALPTTKGIIGKENIEKMKDGVRLINLSRGDLANAPELVEMINSGKVASYVTDFPSEETLALPNTVNIPHLGASTPESEDNCAVMAAKELSDFMLYGNIKNSVNFPNCEMAIEGKYRVTIAHKNIPNMLTRFAGIFADASININNMMNKSKKENAYTILDVDQIPDSVEHQIEQVEGVHKVRVIVGN